MLSVQNVNVHLVDEGSGPPILFLHGNPDSADMWGGIVRRLKGQFRCLAPDLPGFGRSPAPRDFDCSLESMAAAYNTSSLEVARVVLRRDLELHPKIVALDAVDLDRFGQALLGNSITLTPGTLTLDVHEGRLLVHALTPEGAAALEQGEMQRRVKALRGR